jgi:predicted membrane GTPase involved in stress response
MIDIDLHCLDTEQGNIPVTFALQATSIIGYKTCAWSPTGERTIIRLTFDNFQEWVIDPFDKTAVHIISNLVKGIERHSYTFIKLIIR